MMHRPHTASHAAVALWIATYFLPAPSVAQVRVDAPLEPTPFSTHAAIFGVNAFLGGASAGVLSVASGGPFVDAVVRGVLGGGLVYLGKNAASRSFTGAGVLGRQLAAVGNSVMMNAADNQPMFGRILVPMGLLPARVLLTTQGGIRARPMVDVISLGAFATGLISSRYSLDLGTSLSSGAAIFREDDRDADLLAAGAPSRVSGASTVGSVVFINEVLMRSAPSLAHERIHVLQFDFLLASWGDRADSWIMDGARFDRYVKLNIMAGAFGWINQTMIFPSNRHKTPWEREARRLAGQQERPSVVRN